MNTFFSIALLFHLVSFRFISFFCKGVFWVFPR